MPPIDVLEARRPAIVGHCYRMLGSAVDADDATQETLLRAWKHRETFEGRASVNTWLHRIATNVCLDMIAKHGRRTRPTVDGPVGSTASVLVERDARHWIEPIPDAWLAVDDPGASRARRDRVRLAYVTALQALAPKQRAALLLTEVVGFSAVEAAEVLECSVASLNSAAQRARATLRGANLDATGPLDAGATALVNRFVDAFERYDVEALVTVLHEDATMSMPPYTLWLQGHASIAEWLLGPGEECRGSRLVRTRACGGLAFAQYRADPETGGHRAWALVLPQVRGDRIDDLVFFLDTETLFPLFDLVLTLPPG